MRNEALLVGLPEETFWEISLGEARRWILAYNRRKKENLQQQAYLIYGHASLAEISVARGLGEKIEFPNIGDVYPALFDSEEIKVRQQELKEKRDIERFIALTEQWNANFEVTNGRETESDCRGG